MGGPRALGRRRRGEALADAQLAAFRWLRLPAPIVLLLLILFVTGTPPPEEQALRRRGDDHRRYQRETSAFVPLRPRSAE
jgi:cyclopropane-fatty-acyl-phospholipid synthase